MVKAKQMALNKRHGKTVPCNHRNCQCCNIISDKDEFRINGKTVNLHQEIVVPTILFMFCTDKYVTNIMLDVLYVTFTPESVNTGETFIKYCVI